MSEYYRYYNTSDKALSTTVPVNMCQKKGPMSFCRAVEIKDQPGCKYREDASYAEHCMHYRSNLNGACDSIWAQRGIDKPKKDEPETKVVHQAVPKT